MSPSRVRGAPASSSSDEAVSKRMSEYESSDTCIASALTLLSLTNTMALPCAANSALIHKWSATASAKLSVSLT